MYKVIRKFVKHIDGQQLKSWPTSLQKRVSTVVQKMRGYCVAETPLTVKLLENGFLRVEIRGEEGWFIVYEEDGEGSFEPHNDNTRVVYRAFYTP